MAKAKPKQVEKPKRTYVKRKCANWVLPVTPLKNKLAAKDEDIVAIKLQLSEANDAIDGLKGQLNMARARIATLESQARDKTAEKDAYFDLLVKLYTL